MRELRLGTQTVKEVVQGVASPLGREGASPADAGGKGRGDEVGDPEGGRGKSPPKLRPGFTGSSSGADAEELPLWCCCTRNLDLLLLMVAWGLLLLAALAKRPAGTARAGRLKSRSGSQELRMGNALSCCTARLPALSGLFLEGRPMGAQGS